MQKGFAGIYILIALLILAATGGAYYLGANKNKPPFVSSPKMCTQEARQCPDGSWVGRTGPNCEFKVCPTISPTKSIDETANWKTYTNKDIGYSIKYPPDWNFQATSEGCGPVFSPADQNVSKYWNINNYWITICGLYINPDDVPQNAANKILNTPGVKLVYRRERTVDGHYAVEQQSYVSNDSPNQYNGEVDIFIGMVNGTITDENGTPKKDTGTLAVYTYIKDGYALDEAVRNLLLIISTFKFTN